MKHYHDKTKPQLIEEIESLKNRIEELEQSEFKYKLAEQIIKANEIKLRNIIEHSSNLFYSHTPDHVLTYLSPQTREFFDCEPEEVRIRWNEFVTENPNNEIGLILTEKAIKTGKVQPSYELELVGKKGRKLWVEVNEAPVVEGEHTVAIVGALTDITERKQAEEALRESKERFRAVVDTANDAIITIDNRGNIVGWNNSAKVMFGYSVDEIIGQSLSLIMPERYHEDHRNGLRRVASGGVTKIIGKTVELAGLRKDGSEFPLELSISTWKTGEEVFFTAILRDITDRKRAEAALRASENKFRLAMEATNDGLWDWNVKKNETYYNPAAYRIFGCEPGEMEASFQFWKSHIHPDDLQSVMDKLNSHLDGKTETYQAEYRITTKSGDKKWLLSRGKVVERDPDGSPIRVTGTDIDITGRKRAEEAMYESEERFRQIVERSSDIFYRQNINTGKFEYVSPKVMDILGRTPEEMYSMDFEEQAAQIHPDDLPNLIDFVKDLVEADNRGIGFIEREFRIMHKSGEYKWVHGSYNLIRDTNGEPEFIVGGLRDITERKQAEEVLQQSEDKYRHLFESAIDMIHIVDEQYRIVDINETELRKLGYSRSELIGKPLMNIIHPDFRPITQAGIPKVRSGHTISSYNTALRTKDGDTIFVTANVVPMIVEGRFCGAHAILHDITERKRAEEKLLKSEYFLSESQKVAHLGSYVLDIAKGRWTSSEILDDLFGIDDNFIKNIDGWSDIIHPDSRDEILKYFDEIILKRHQKFDKEYRIIRIMDDEERWVHGLGELELDSEGNPVKMIGTIQDITERKRSEEALRKSKERYRTLYQKTPAMLHSIDKEGRLTNVSKYWLKEMGYSLNEVLGHYSTDFMTEESSRYAKEVILPKFYETGSCRDVPYQYVKKNGEVMDALLSAITEYDENGELIHSLSVIIDVTDRKKAEESLRQSEARLRQVIDLVPHYIFAKDYKGRFILANRASAESMGTTPEKIIGKTEMEIALVKEEAQVFTKDDAEVISNSKPKFIPEGRFTDVKGKLHVLQTIKIPFTASGTQSPSVLGVSVDITERKKAEEAHRESEERFSRLSGAAFEGIVISDGGKIVDVNDQLAKMMGYKPEEIIGKSAMEFVAPESRELVMNNIKSGTEGSYEHFALKNDGSIFPVEVQAKMLPYEGRSFRVTAIRDITERKKAEEALKESEEKFRNLSDNSPNMIFINQGGKIVYANKGCEEFMGYTRDEFYSSHFDFRKLIEPEYLEALMANFKGHMEGKDVPPMEYALRAKSGKRIESIINTKLISYGGKSAILGIVTDITERKQAEKRIRESHNRLRSLAERLQKIREEERATIAREIHDDLGQSLTALKMDISWMKNNPEMDAEAKMAKFEMMLDLTDSTIQTVKRIATELRPGILDDLGLIPAIEWQAAEFQNRFKVQCNVSINKSDVIIKDEISIAVFRIFQETLTNVARHSSANKLDVKLNFYDDNKLVMEIADNGVGIDEEQINSPKSLGLFGMRERVNILKGEMEIIGEHEKGTTIKVTIPY
ncbi:MAG: PAS domain S-box protein [Bacteroidetes bacterium]|nr:PAS domain S-box protein [Bacteroidota bacterium]